MWFLVILARFWFLWLMILINLFYSVSFRAFFIRIRAFAGNDGRVGFCFLGWVSVLRVLLIPALRE